MKKFIITTVSSVLFVLSGMAQAADKFYVENFSINAGESKTVSVNMDNASKSYCSFQFDIYLPNGMTIALNKKGKPDVKLNEDRIEDHTLSVEQVEDSHYRFVCVTLSNSNFYENSGAILNLTVTAASDMANGVYDGSLKNIVLVPSDGVKTTIDESAFSVTLGSTGINQVLLDSVADVYDLQGNKVRSNATDLNGLPNGVFIINGKKVVVRK